MADFVRQSQLRNFRRHTGIVIDESYDTGVQTPLGGLV